MIPNVLADRYASRAMKEIWSAEGRIILERDFWIAVMRAQRELGLPITEEAIAAYEAVKTKVNLESIEERERISRHDVKARLEEFNDLAGHQEIHKGMTSRDLTENVEQLQVFSSLRLIHDKAIASLTTLAKRAHEWRDVILAGRTHNVAAQPTTFGKRISMSGEELLDARHRLDGVEQALLLLVVLDVGVDQQRVHLAVDVLDGNLKPVEAARLGQLHLRAEALHEVLVDAGDRHNLIHGCHFQNECKMYC